MRAYERLLRYAVVDSQSAHEAAVTPSTQKQFDMARLLKDEMEAMGLAHVYADEHAYVYGFLPATPGREDDEVIGLIAHIDTAPDFNGTGVKPRVVENYGGGDVALGQSGLTLSPAQFPDLKVCAGHTLITTDGTSLLGADDKAGIAEILTACERLMQEGRPHGGVALCFPPDEEIGHGAALLDLGRLGAAYAYTVDGGALEEINCETFNAAAARFTIRGVSVHPGSAKDVMINASLVAMEINAQLPPDEIPARTEGYEGYYHVTDVAGDVGAAELKYIIRDHDAARFAARCEKMRAIESAMNEKYGAGTVTLGLREEYRNMAEALKGREEIVERAVRAVKAAGLTPVIRPVRGGTDGSKLSFRGLPCPNVGTGGAGFHGPYEHISAERMDTAVEILLNIICGE
jgi:tripeptide aminopeptidase